MKVLMTCANLYATGITAVVLNFAAYLPRHGVSLELAVGGGADGNVTKELEKLGVKLYMLPQRRKNPFRYRRALKKVIRGGNYDIVHVHGNSATMVLELSVAKKCKVPVRVAHCHNSVCGSMLRHRLLSPFFNRSYTHAVACSSVAGEWIFGKGNFTVIKNGVVAENFAFSAEKRERYRRELGLSDNLVLGHVGRFNEQKNHAFLLKTFEELLQKRGDARLLLVGNGPKFDEISAYIADKPYADKVIVYGVSDDVSGLLSAMDVFVFPSLYEGLGIALVEAQINGLKVICSDACPREANVTDRLKFLPLDSEGAWAESIAGLTADEERNSQPYIEMAIRAGYASGDVAAELARFYADALKKGI